MLFLSKKKRSNTENSPCAPPLLLCGGQEGDQVKFSTASSQDNDGPSPCLEKGAPQGLIPHSACAFKSWQLQRHEPLSENK